MRISTNTIFEKGVARMGELQTSVAKTQQQVSTGRRIVSPSDDPVAAARALEVTQSQSVNSQFAINRRNAKDSLSLEETALANITSLIQDVQTLAVNAGNGALDNSQRQFLATELSGRLDNLLGLANTRDGAGNYLFAGFQSTQQAFVKTATGANYVGDQGQRTLQVGAFRTMAISATGSEVFENIKTGNGTFTTAPASGNTGSGIVSTGSVTNAAALTGESYEIRFTSATQFDIVNVSTAPATTLSSANAYVSGQSIALPGMQLDITGSPAANDVFTVKPSARENIFETLTDLIGVLNTPATGAAGQAKLANGLNAAHNSLNNALDRVLTVRASVGASLNEIDSLDSLGEDMNLQYAQSLSDLQDLDYVQAITDLTKNQTALQAAQQSFVKISGLSLFNYMS